jgi:hypothetical protein
MNIAMKWSIVCKQRGGIRVKKPMAFAENGFFLWSFGSRIGRNFESTEYHHARKLSQLFDGP